MTPAEGRDVITVFNVQSNWASAKVLEVGGTIKYFYWRLGQFDAGRGEGRDYGFQCPKQVGKLRKFVRWKVR